MGEIVEIHDDTQSEPSSDEGGILVAKKRTRTRSGCLNCRRKRRKCDEKRPVCLSCSRREESCEWGMRISFRAEHAKTIHNDHPSMCATPSRKRPRRFQIMDVTTEIIRDYQQYATLCAPESESPQDCITVSDRREQEDLTRQSTNDTCAMVIDTGPAEETSMESTNYMPATEALLYSVEQCSPFGRELEIPSRLVGPRPPAVIQSPTSGRMEGIAPAQNTPNSQTQTECAAANLLHLRGTVPQPETAPQPEPPLLGFQLTSPSYSSYIESELSPEGFHEDSVFLPGSTYHELHSTLRHHLIHDLGMANPTRPCSPVREVSSRQQDTTEQAARNSHQEPSAEEGQDSLNQHVTPEISKEEEYRLWKNYFDEVAPWLDKFDNNRHFQNTLPIMAKTNDHLRYAILAVSARQFERMDPNRPIERSLALYQEAIHQLLPLLHTRSTAVIASCVVLCVLEMMSCSPKAWQRHLDGCANLMEAVGINGFVGGVEQALFWCFARMDVCGGLITSCKTLIPVSHWASKIDLDADVGLFRATTAYDTYANHAVYLCAQVLDLINHNNIRTARHAAPFNPGHEGKHYGSRWLKLWRFIDDWQAKRPAELQPTLAISSSTMSPFPTVLFSNSAAISGNQLYHTAAILMLKHKPPSLRLENPKPRSVLWHARQICGISLSNDHHGAWTNSVQPLWIAGQCMSHPSEHAAILEILDRIERECGWGTKWRVNDLKEYWGDLGD